MKKDHRQILMAIVFGFLFLQVLNLFSYQSAHAQLGIQVNQTTPCFQNYTATYEIFTNCNAQEDYLAWALMGWNWVSGGFFTMILVSVLIVSSWIKYKEAIYPIFIGLVYLPFTFFFFPQQFLAWAIVMAFVAVGTYIWYALVKQTQ